MSGRSTPRIYSARDPNCPPAPIRPRLGPHAFRGVLGDLVRILDPHTEADPAAVLILMPWPPSGASPVAVLISSPTAIAHHANLFAVIVAASSKGRKGNRVSHVRNCFTAIDSDWRIVSGLASGEGLIWARARPAICRTGGPSKTRRSGERETVLQVVPASQTSGCLSLNPSSLVCCACATGRARRCRRRYAKPGTRGPSPVSRGIVRPAPPARTSPSSDTSRRRS